jgi:hypothetical protein
MEESKQLRCHREARKYPRMREKKPGAPRKTFRSTRMSDRREPMKKQHDQNRSRKNAMKTTSLCLGVNESAHTAEI